MAYRDRYDLETLRVRAYLRTGAVADRFLPLDGLLLYQAHRRQSGPQLVTLPGAYSGKGPPTLPLGITNSGRKNWYYQSSWAQWSHEVEGQDYWNKRFDSQFADLIDFGGRRGSVNIKSGRNKAYHMPIFYRVALWVEWYCVGDRTDIEALLSTVTNIGKKGAQGWGRISRWEVAQWPADWHLWNGERLMRGVPSEEALALIQETDQPFDFKKGIYGIRPSYWHQKNQRELVMPV